MKSVIEMTSAELYNDPAAHPRYHRDYLQNPKFLEAFGKAIEENAHLIKGKTVLDIHCGIGILSLLAARAGAKRVIGVEVGILLIASPILYFHTKIIPSSRLGNYIADA